MPDAAAQNIAEIIDEGPITGQQYLIVGLCMLFNMVDGFDITAMAVTVHQIGQELNLGTDKLGLVFSFSLAGMMIGAMFLAGLSDVIGRRKVIIISLALVGLTVLLTAYADSLWLLIFLRFVSGLGAGATLASVATLTAEYSPEKYRSLCVTAVTAGYPLGATMTGLVANEIVPEFGWRSMFLFGGVVTIGLTLVAWLAIPESLQYLCKKQPEDALERINKILNRLSRPKLRTLPGLDATTETTEIDRQNIVEKMFSLLTPGFRLSTLKLWVTVFLCICTLYFLMSWIPKMVIDLGYGTDVGNLAFTLFNFGGVLGIFALGYMASRWTLTNLIALFVMIAAVLMWAFAAAASAQAGQMILMTLIFLVGFSLSGGYTGLYAVAAKIYPIEIRSTGVGWAIGLGRSGAVIGPGAAGYMLAAGLTVTTNFLVFAIPLVAGGILAYRLKVK